MLVARLHPMAAIRPPTLPLKFVCLLSTLVTSFVSALSLRALAASSRSVFVPPYPQHERKHTPQTTRDSLLLCIVE